MDSGETIVLLLENENEIVEESDTFLLNEDWKSDQTLLSKVKEYCEKAVKQTKKSENETYFVTVEVVHKSAVVETKYALELENYIESLQDSLN